MSLYMRGIHKSFGANDVLKGVDFSLQSGEIRALIGENGAGKSTLMNILGGILKPDAGTIELDGVGMSFDTPRDSLDAGIAFIHQELNLVTDLNIYENLYLGRELKNGIITDRRTMIRNTRKMLEKLEIDISPETRVGDLDASFKQMIEIARALLFKAKIIIMDEPTTSLTEPEIERVFKLMRGVKEMGVSVVFISHKLDEVFKICDTYTVLRDGALAHTGRTADVTSAEIARWMIGHDVRTERLSCEKALGNELLRAEHLSRGRSYRDVSFTLHAGEILGFTGLLGDGRSELFQSVFGVTQPDSGLLYINGRRAEVTSTFEALKLGIGYVPRDRKENGILPDMTVLENGSIVTYSKFSRLGCIRHKQIRANMDRNVRELSVKVADINDLITSLSGGNQQKIVLAKWLSAAPKILIFDNPTQGVDVGAKEEIYDIMLNLAKSGVAIAVLSSEAQEIIRVCDRCLVMYHGEVRGELTGDAMNEHTIMQIAMGERVTEE